MPALTGITSSRVTVTVIGAEDKGQETYEGGGGKIQEEAKGEGMVGSIYKKK